MSTCKKKLKELIKAINSIENQEEVFCDLLLNIDGNIDENIDYFLNRYEPKGSIKNLKIFKSHKTGLAASLNNLLLNNFIFYGFSLDMILMTIVLKKIFLSIKFSKTKS